MKKLTVLLMAALAVAGCSDSGDAPATVAEAKGPGQLVYESHCIVCHSNGINGAPIPGKPRMWAARIEQGEAVLIEHAINGYGLMPPKGGKTEMPDADVAAAVRYMVGQSLP